MNDPLLVRIAEAVDSARRDQEAVGSSDIAALLKQAMLRHRIAYNDHIPLRVPHGGVWPTPHTWKLFNCETSPAGAGELFVRPCEWSPGWLDVGAGAAVEEAIVQQQRRINRPAPPDPAAKVFAGLSQYLSVGQRAAVQTAFLSPAGSTSILSLPTGAGKSLVFQLPALVWSGERALTIVVVPTVALAKDQEARFKALAEATLPRLVRGNLPLAYHGGLAENEKRALWSGLVSGDVPILFTSPEALFGRLREAVFETARQGRLRWFAVDEAHIVTQWGQNFRPEFQSLAGFKNALLAACPPDRGFRTLLLSATLTDESIDTLRSLFGSDETEVVTELSLRPEPSFLISTARDEPERIERVIEGVLHLPRPLILYTTSRDDAQDWYQRLRNLGFRRLRLVRGGDLSAASGDRVLAEWRENAVDLVVATSAFGLGIEHQGVRSVIHACLPETIDRFYQEVGRAGRDGQASVSLLVTAPSDRQTAERLARDRSISVARGFERWDAMWLRRRRVSENTFALSLDDRPTDITSPGEYNASWNLRTLVLMARAKLIAFAVHSPDLVRRDGESDAEFDERSQRELRRYASEVAVQVLDPALTSISTWSQRVGAVRNALSLDDERGVNLIMELQRLERAINEVFHQVYTLRNPPVSPPRFPGNCPVTRTLGTANSRAPEPDVSYVNRPHLSVAADMRAALTPCVDDAGRAWVSYPPPGDRRENRKWHDDLLLLLAYSVSAGFVGLDLADVILSESEWKSLLVRSPHRFVTDCSNTGRSSLVEPPRVSVVRSGTLPGDVSRLMRVNASPHLLLIPNDAPDPSHPSRRLVDVVRHLRLVDLLAALES